jgi:hypothetical protein
MPSWRTGRSFRISLREGDPELPGAARIETCGTFARVERCLTVPVEAAARAGDLLMGSTSRSRVELGGAVFGRFASGDPLVVRRRGPLSAVAIKSSARMRFLGILQKFVD